jgi:hypothetical protein
MTRDDLQALAATWPYCDFWEFREGGEGLSHTEVIEALEEAIDRNYEKGISCEECIRQMGDVTLYGWTRKTPSEDDIRRLTSRALEAVFEFMGDWLEWTNPDSDGEPNGHLPEGFERVIREDLKTRFIWGCDQKHKIDLTTEQVIGIARLEWPDWFEGES